MYTEAAAVRLCMKSTAAMGRFFVFPILNRCKPLNMSDHSFFIMQFRQFYLCIRLLSRFRYTHIVFYPSFQVFSRKLPFFR